MPISKQLVSSWSKAPLKFKNNVYPQCNDGGDAPRFFWVSVFCGARASGKTHTMCKLLKHYERNKVIDPETGENMEQRIILFSPTYDANPVWQTLKNLDETDVHGAYSDEKLREVVEDIQFEQKATSEYKKALQLYNKYQTIQSINELTDSELIELEKHNFEIPEPPRFKNGAVNVILFDDLVGTTALRNGKSMLNYLTIRNRHLRVFIGLLVQGMKQVPKIIRQNTNVFAIWKFANKKMVLEDLYEEVSSCLKPGEFEELYDYCTADEHGCMVMDFSQPKERRFKKDFAEIVKICP